MKLLIPIVAQGERVYAEIRKGLQLSRLGCLSWYYTTPRLVRRFGRSRDSIAATLVGPSTQPVTGR
jgi:hypothetical protein